MYIKMLPPNLQWKKGKVTLVEAHPELIPEWSTSNKDITPDKISYGSNRKVLWLGKCGHEWEATVKNRCNGSGCPYCTDVR